MVLTLSIMAIIVAFSLYDYFSSRSWQAVTSRERNETVFENRNKEYGAYQIRKDYDKRIVLVFVGVTLGIGGIWGASNLLKPSEQIKEDIIIVDNIPGLFDKPEETPEIPEEKIVEQPATESMAEIIEFREPIVSDKQPDTKPIEIVNPETPVGTEGQKGDGETIWDNPIINKNPGTGSGGTIEPPKIDEPVPYVDEPAQFPGGMDALREFIRDNIDLSMIDGSAKVSLKFVVDTDGTISSVIVTKTSDDCKSCEKAAIKVVKSMPNWKPGKLNGREVKSYYRLPINIQ